MGLETAIANHTTKELFDLGKGPWFRLVNAVVSEDGQTSWDDRFRIEAIVNSEEALGNLILEEVVADWDWEAEQTLAEYTQKIGKFLFNWLKDCEFCVIYDTDDGWEEFNVYRQYKWIGHRYGKEYSYRNRDTDHNIVETFKIPSLDEQLKRFEVKS